MSAERQHFLQPLAQAENAVGLAAGHDNQAAPSNAGDCDGEPGFILATMTTCEDERKIKLSAIRLRNGCPPVALQREEIRPESLHQGEFGIEFAGRRNFG